MEKNDADQHMSADDAYHRYIIQRLDASFAALAENSKSSVQTPADSVKSTAGNSPVRPLPIEDQKQIRELVYKQFRRLHVDWLLSKRCEG